MTTELEPGTRFGKYELLEKIGTGGMAEIYKARVTGPDDFEKILVVKKILPEYAQNRAFVKMLIAEAKVSSVLQHGNIVQIFELGEIEDQYYIAMEYVQGADLLRILTRCTRRKERPPVEVVMFVVSEVCKGLAYAHSATDTKGRPLRIIHRDVSPSNILISDQGDVKIMDFGVARADLERASHERRQQTASGVLKGKLGYMSPEQVVGAEIDHRSDIFALGIILFEALTLKRLFLGKTDLETLINIRDVRIEHKLRKHRYIPEGIRDMLRRALARDPRDRYQTATDFQEAILDYLFENRLRVSNPTLARFMDDVFAERKTEAEPRPRRHGARKAASTRPTRRAGAAAAAEERRTPATTTQRELEEAARAATGLVEGEQADEAPSEEAAEPRDAKETAAEAEAGGPEEAEAAAPTEESGEREIPVQIERSSSTDATHAALEYAERHTPAERQDLTKALFRLRHRDGATFGPVTFTNLMNLLTNRSISAREEVSVDGRDWIPVRELPALRELEPTLFEEEEEAALYEGPISNLLTPRLLYKLSISRLAGRLKLTRGSLLKEIYFQNGVPVHITSNIKEELLGAFMLERSLIQEEDLDRAVASTKSHGGRLGDSLVRLGILEPHDLFRVLELQFRQKFLEIFRWRRGWYQFFEGHQPPDDMVWMGHDTVQLLTVGVRTQYDLPTMRETFEDFLDQTIRLEANPHITHNNLRFNSRELRFYTYLEDGMSLREAVARFGRTEDECLTLLQVVFVLHQTDLLTLTTPQAPIHPA
ncbi:MAG: serine/threonine protein kinase [Myxococcota bacterium]